MPLLALCPGYFMTILDVTIINVALVDMKEHLNANVTGLQWIIDGYSISSIPIWEGDWRWSYQQ
jgi:DHA2 family methylenomycin A resistance protein-like MFS transporter